MRRKTIPFYSPEELYAARVQGAPESIDLIGLGPISQADRDNALLLETKAAELVNENGNPAA